MDRREIGFVAEGYAAQSLEKRGYRILDYNFRRPWGEIDVIAEKDGVIVFVEVKANSRRQDGFDPELRADWRKMQKVVRTARTYLAEKRYPPDQEWQIDVVAVTFNPGMTSASIKHFKNIELA